MYSGWKIRFCFKNANLSPLQAVLIGFGLAPVYGQKPSAMAEENATGWFENRFRERGDSRSDSVKATVVLIAVN